MKLVGKLLILAIVLGLLFAIEFALFGQYFDFTLSQEQCSKWFAEIKPFAWGIGIALLMSDILLPIPASGVMAALGSVYGIWLGAAISAIGSIGAAGTGYLLARLAGRRLIHWLASEEELERFKWFFDRWGGWAIIASRIMPILPEVIAILAGIARMKTSRFIVALLLGTIPTCILFSYLGFTTRETPWYGIGLASVLPLLFWPFFIRLQKNGPSSKPLVMSQSHEDQS